MTAVEFLVDELKKRSIDLTLWHKDLVKQAKEIEQKNYNKRMKKDLTIKK